MRGELAVALFQAFFQRVELVAARVELFGAAVEAFDLAGEFVAFPAGLLPVGGERLAGLRGLVAGLFAFGFQLLAQAGDVLGLVAQLRALRGDLRFAFGRVLKAPVGVLDAAFGVLKSAGCFLGLSA